MTKSQMLISWIVGCYILYPVLVGLANKGVSCFWEWKVKYMGDFIGLWLFSPVVLSAWVMFIIPGLIALPVWYLVKGKED